ncbi:MAG: holo-ACP synthase [Alphaproteobacteria bacterium]|nr:holo-ACP synthase [Alphaproteobacteria bacterium]MDA7982896.1 holo-ACP synthase [Alphaproteobacteria bacterium]MDA7984278.1 holo-ACP synthase [Alphaproteobacteria bacterium]MDA7987126.1 holo-ACP synthase [Alphaproteobacteria bacterium]MDA7988481.1 holo-ACP synthase [Alphaproteobacteria bacterium]
MSADTASLAVGIDIVDIRRIERVLDRFGDRFTRRVFTSGERDLADRRGAVLSPRGNGRAATYARRFAAKEACAKALGTGVPRRGVYWRDIGVVRGAYGAPALALTGGAETRARFLAEEAFGAGAESLFQISLTDDYPYAQAVVLFQARPRR